MRLPVFTVPESWLLFIVQSTSDFTCLPLLNVWRRGYSFGFGMKNLHSSLRSVVFLIPRPNIPLSLATRPLGVKQAKQMVIYK